MKLFIHCVRPAVVEPSPHVLRVAAMFGLGIEQADRGEIEIVPATELELDFGQVVFITGPSGGGKSTLLRLIHDAVAALPDAPRLLRFDGLPDLLDRPLVDVFGDHPLESIMQWLSLSGLNDAFVMLRKPSELSDGQRYRLRLAQMMSMIESEELTVVLADEFGASLDRITAAVVSMNLRKWVNRNPHVMVVVATTHDDLLEPLSPDVLIEKQLGGEIEIITNPRID